MCFIFSPALRSTCSVSLINSPVLFSDAPFIKVHTQHIVKIVILLFDFDVIG